MDETVDSWVFSSFLVTVGLDLFSVGSLMA